MVISYWLLVISVTERRADRGIFVVAVIAVVACNACNARIARNADGSGCVQRRNDVDDSQWSGGPESSVMGPECSSVIGSSLQAMVQ